MNTGTKEVAQTLLKKFSGGLDELLLAEKKLTGSVRLETLKEEVNSLLNHLDGLDDTGASKLIADKLVDGFVIVGLLAQTVEPIASRNAILAMIGGVADAIITNCMIPKEPENPEPVVLDNPSLN